MIKPSKRNAASAFTLVEILIAMAIFGMLMLAIYESWAAIMRGSKAGLQAAAAVQRSRMAVSTLESALMSAQMFDQNMKYYAFVADTAGDFASLSLAAHLPRSFPRSGMYGDFRVRRVTFAVEPSAHSGNELVLHQTPLLMQTTDDEQDNPLVLARNVKQFTLEFWDVSRRDWVDQFLYTNQLPKMVRITLAFSDTKKSSLRPEDYVTRVVSLPATIVARVWQIPGLSPGAITPGMNPGLNGANQGLNGVNSGLKGAVNGRNGTPPPLDPFGNPIRRR